jgi:non-heme chloroperoxidase
VLVAPGDGDQIVSPQASAPKSAELLSNATLKIYLRAPHGLHGEFAREFNQDLLDFVKA